MAPADFVVVGASHKTSSTAVRDRLFVDSADEPDVLSELRAQGFGEVVVISTCDRVEIHGLAADRDGAIGAARALLESRLGGQPVEPGAIAASTGRDAVRHLFAVAASLESVVIGEPEVLGQVKQAHDRARTLAMSGPALDTLFQRAFSAAKDVRSGTVIAEGPISLANAALRAVRNLFGSLDEVSALLVGPGEMGALMLDHFRASGLRTVTVAGPTTERAAAAGRAHSAYAVTYDELNACLPSMDLVICAAGTGRILLNPPMVEDVLRTRRRDPVFILDVAIPSDADRAIVDLEDVFLYDLDDLEAVARQNQAARAAAAEEAWRIVDRHVDAFERASAERGAAGPVSELREHFEAVRTEVMSQANGADTAEVTRRLVNRLLHEPSRALRDAAREDGAASATAEAARRLFDLENKQAPDAEDFLPRSESDEP